MKKTSLIIGLALLVAPLAGCDFGDKTISVENISLSETNLNIYVGDSKTLTATVTPDNATDKTVTWSVAPQGVVSVNEGAVSAIAAGECVITAKAGEKEATCNVKVEERIVPVNEQYYISEVNQNANIQTYKLNTGESTDYKGAIERLQVGTDNAFVMKPNLLVYSEETDLPVDSSVWTYPYEYKIEELDGASFVDAKATYAEFDASKASFNFNENAVGKTLKLSVMPGGLDAIDQADPRFTKTIEVNVAEGYNVYSAKELAYFDDPVNCSHRWATEYSLSVEQTQAAWTKFREENGLDKTYVADNIFLQSNIEITTKDIPSEFIYSEGQGGKVGYLRDSTDIYFKENRNTLFNGNYFDINTSKLPMADVDPDWDNISHTTLFKVYEARTDVAGEQVFKNCSYFGNGARSENETPKGGLIFVKFCSVNDALQSNVSFSNFNMEAALISLYVESHARVTVDSCDIEQGFSNFMYVYHKGIIDIKNCVIKDFGGPAIIGDVDKDLEETYCPIITIDNNTTIESWCCGEEPWFISTGASAAFSQVTALNGFYTSVLSSKTFMKELDGHQVLNCIYVSKSSSGSVYGSVKFGDKQMGIDSNSSPELKGLYNGFAPYMPILSTDVGGRALVFADPVYTAGNTILTDTFDLGGLTTGQFKNLCSMDGYGNPIYDGNYLHLAMSNPVFGGITLVTQLFNQAA